MLQLYGRTQQYGGSMATAVQIATCNKTFGKDNLNLDVYFMDKGRKITTIWCCFVLPKYSSRRQAKPRLTSLKRHFTVFTTTIPCQIGFSEYSFDSLLSNDQVIQTCSIGSMAQYELYIRVLDAETPNQRQNQSFKSSGHTQSKARHQTDSRLQNTSCK